MRTPQEQLINDLRKEIIAADDVYTEYSEFRKETATLRRKYGGALVSLKAARAKLSDFERENNQLKTSFVTIDDHNAVLVKCNELEAQHYNIRAEYNDYINSTEIRYQKSCKEYDDKLAASELQINLHQQEIAEFKLKIQESSKKSCRKKPENKKTQSNVELVESSTVSQLNIEIPTLKTRLEQLAGELQCCKSEKEAEIQLKVKEAVKIHLKQKDAIEIQLKQKVANEVKLIKELEKLKNQIKNLNEQHAKEKCNLKQYYKAEKQKEEAKVDEFIKQIEKHKNVNLNLIKQHEKEQCSIKEYYKALIIEKENCIKNIQTEICEDNFGTKGNKEIVQVGRNAVPTGYESSDVDDDELRQALTLACPVPSLIMRIRSPPISQDSSVVDIGTSFMIKQDNIVVDKIAKSKKQCRFNDEDERELLEILPSTIRRKKISMHTQTNDPVIKRYTSISTQTDTRNSIEQPESTSIVQRNLGKIAMVRKVKSHKKVNDLLIHIIQNLSDDDTPISNDEDDNQLNFKTGHPNILKNNRLIIRNNQENDDIVEPMSVDSGYIKTDNEAETELPSVGRTSQPGKVIEKNIINQRNKREKLSSKQKGYSLLSKYETCRNENKKIDSDSERSTTSSVESENLKLQNLNTTNTNCVNSQISKKLVVELTTKSAPLVSKDVTNSNSDQKESVNINLSKDARKTVSSENPSPTVVEPLTSHCESSSSDFESFVNITKNKKASDVKKKLKHLFSTPKVNIAKGHKQKRVSHRFDSELSFTSQDKQTMPISKLGCESEILHKKNQRHSITEIVGSDSESDRLLIDESECNISEDQNKKINEQINMVLNSHSEGLSINGKHSERSTESSRLHEPLTSSSNEKNKICKNQNLQLPKDDARLPSNNASKVCQIKRNKPKRQYNNSNEDLLGFAVKSCTMSTRSMLKNKSNLQLNKTPKSSKVAKAKTTGGRNKNHNLNINNVKSDTGETENVISKRPTTRKYVNDMLCSFSSCDELYLKSVKLLNIEKLCETDKMSSATSSVKNSLQNIKTAASDDTEKISYDNENMYSLLNPRKRRIAHNPKANKKLKSTEAPIFVNNSELRKTKKDCVNTQNSNFVKKFQLNMPETSKQVSLKSIHSILEPTVIKSGNHHEDLSKLCNIKPPNLGSPRRSPRSRGRQPNYKQLLDTKLMKKCKVLLSPYMPSEHFDNQKGVSNCSTKGISKLQSNYSSVAAVVSPRQHDIPEMSNEHGKSLLTNLLQFHQIENTISKAKDFMGQNLEFVAKLVLEQVISDRQDKPAQRRDRLEPLLTINQKALLSLMTVMEKMGSKGIRDAFLQEVEAKLPTLIDVECLQPITKLYVAICQQNLDHWRLRTALCKSFISMGDLAIPFIYFVLLSWSEVMPKKDTAAHSDIISRAIVHLIFLKKCNKPGYNMLSLRQLLLKRYEYTSDFDSSQQLLVDLFKHVIKEGFFCSEMLALALSEIIDKKWVFTQLELEIKPKINTTNNVHEVVNIIRLVTSVTTYLYRKLNPVVVETTKSWLKQFCDSPFPDCVRDMAESCLKHLQT